MKAAFSRSLLFITGLALIAWALLPVATMPASAAPPLLVTETSTAEPATPTPPPSATPTEVLQLTPEPSVTPLPTEPPRDNERPRPTATPTATPPPTATPTPAVVAAPADPAISKTVSPGEAGVGTEVTYTIVVANIGGSLATGVVVDDTLPAFLTPTGVSTSKGEASLSGQTVRVVIGDLAPGETVTITVQATVNAVATPPNNRNLAVVTSTSPDANPDNNQASVPVDTLVPVVLPPTGDDGRGLLPLAALLLGLLLVVGSLVTRRRGAS